MQSQDNPSVKAAECHGTSNFAVSGSGMVMVYLGQKECEITKYASKGSVHGLIVILCKKSYTFCIFAFSYNFKPINCKLYDQTQMI